MKMIIKKGLAKSIRVCIVNGTLRVCLSFGLKEIKWTNTKGIGQLIVKELLGVRRRSSISTSWRLFFALRYNL